MGGRVILGVRGRGKGGLEMNRAIWGKRIMENGLWIR